MRNLKKNAAAFSAALVMTLSSVPLGVTADEIANEEFSGSGANVVTQKQDSELNYNSSADTKKDTAKETKTETKLTVGDLTDMTVSNVTTTGYTISWNKVSGADGYHIYTFSNGNPKLLLSTKSTGVNMTVKPGTKHTFRVCAYKNNGTETVEGGYQQKQFASKPEKVEGFTYRRTKRGGLIFTWEPVSKATKYQLYYSADKSGPFTLFKEVAGDKLGVSTGLMPKGKRLYFKVRAVTQAKNNTAAGTCSKKVLAAVFNTLTVDEVMDSYSNSRSVKVVNGQGYNISDSLKNSLYNQLTYLGGDTGYILYDIDSGAAVAYNADQYFMPASSVKAPFMMYGLKMMDKGHSTLDTKVTYTAAQKHGGSGVIQNAAFGTQYTIRTLYQYIADYSDNVAYYMIQDHFGIDGYNKYISSLGCKTSLKKNVDRWGVVCATDAAREWDDIWDYLQHGAQAKFARKIYSSTCAANFRNQLGGKYTVYEKSGWTDGYNGYHNETALVRAEHPYIIICLTNRSSSQRMMDVAQVSENIHNAMWNYYK